jgi:hypothetical protein
VDGVVEPGAIVVAPEALVDELESLVPVPVDVFEPASAGVPAVSDVVPVVVDVVPVVVDWSASIAVPDVCADELVPGVYGVDVLVAELLDTLESAGVAEALVAWSCSYSCATALAEARAPAARHAQIATLSLFRVTAILRPPSCLLRSKRKRGVVVPTPV